MPVDTSHNSSFSKLVPGLQLAWDSTSLGLLKECPRKYYFSVICGYTSSNENMHLLFGEWYHKVLEKYDHARCEGLDHDAATYSAVGWLLRNATVVRTRITCRSGVNPDSGGYACGAVTLTSEPADEITQCPSCGAARGFLVEPNVKVAWDSGDKHKNRFNLVRSAVWYLEQFKDHPLETIVLANGKPAVELSFRFEPGWYTLGGEPYILCGHLDRLAKMGNQSYILDRKTTKNGVDQKFFSGFTPDNQMSLYTIAGRVCFGHDVSGVIIDGAQVAVNFTRFERGFADRTLDNQEEWLEETRDWIEIAEGYARRERWPANDKSCSNYGGCSFRDICSKSPKVRETYLKKFETRTWDPLVPR